MRLPNGHFLTIEEDFDNGTSRGVLVCLAEGKIGSDEFGDTLSREPVYEPGTAVPL
jgi:hypothetical protein